MIVKFGVFTTSILETIGANRSYFNLIFEWQITTGTTGYRIRHFNGQIKGRGELKEAFLKVIYKEFGETPVLILVKLVN